MASIHKVDFQGNCSNDNNSDINKLNERERKKIQHELKIYMEKYFKQKLGKSVDYTKIVLWDDMLIIQGEGFLTEPEKYIVKTTAGKDVVNDARMHVARQHAIDNIPYFQTLLSAKVIHQTYMVDAEKDFWMHVMVFNRILTQ